MVIILIGIVSLSAAAQIYIGGAIGLGYDIDEEAVDFSISPEFGYNFNNKWAVGGSIGYSYTGEYELNILVLQPYARFTFARMANDKLHFFCDGTIGAGLIVENNDDPGIIWNIGLKPGISYDINNHWSLMAHLGFIGYNGADDNAKYYGARNKIGLDISSLNLSFGAYYSF